MAIMNDGAQQMVKVWQKLFFDGRLVATDNVNPDYVALGEAYGFESFSVDNVDDLPAAVEWFVNATVGAAEALGMEGYIHWDVDLFMDNATTNRTIELIKRYEGTAIKGVFQLASDPLGSKTQSPTFVGSLPVFKPIYQCLPHQAFS